MSLQKLLFLKKNMIIQNLQLSSKFSPFYTEIFNFLYLGQIQVPHLFLLKECVVCFILKCFLFITEITVFRNNHKIYC